MVFRSQPVVAENATGAAVTEALFKLMDANNDGKLTKDEVMAVERLLATHDADEDECLSQAELVPTLFDPRAGRALQVQLELEGRRGQPQQVPDNQTVVTYD